MLCWSEGNIRAQCRRKHFGLGIFELICATPSEVVAALRRVRRYAKQTKRTSLKDFDGIENGYNISR